MILRAPGLALVALALAGAAAGCSTDVSTAPAPRPPDAAATPTRLAPPEFDEGLVHVHGLGVDPADGQLYAASHSGLFRIPLRGEAERVANRAQDTMGFTVTGPHTFLASGHPDFREDDVRPPLLGLIASTDAGQSWERLSLHGTADFHSLDVSEDVVYGYDATSQTLMATRDRRAWQSLARLPLDHIAVDPQDLRVLLATSSDGLLRSTDGGRSFSPVPDATRAVLLDWAAHDQLYRVDADGSVWFSSDAGRSWNRRGVVPGVPEAVAVDVHGKGAVYVASSPSGILVSRDGGLTFATRYRG